jgi:DHA2 family multidrug resistance protein-like MFS transporter
VLLLPTLLISMDMMVLYFAVPFISRDLQPSATEQLWIMDMYGFLLAGLLVTMGSLGDRIGRRRLLMLGTAAFGAASLAAAYADSAGTLIAARALLGIAGATLAPSTLALLRNMFHDPGQRKAAIATWTAVFSGGAALGPIVGGLLLEHFWWGSVFLINVPAMVLLLVTAPRLLPEHRAPQPGRLDLTSAALSAAAVLVAIYGIKEMAQHGVAPVPAASLVAGLLLGGRFVARQRAIANPLIDVELFRHRAYSAAIGVNTLAAFTMAGFGLFSTQYLQLVYGLSPLHAGLWSLPVPLAVGAAAGAATALSKVARAAAIVSGGIALMVAGLLVMLGVDAHSPLAVALAGSTIMAFGIGLAVTLLNDLILSAAPPERAGAAAAVSETGNELGAALGVALLGSIGAAVYRHDAGAAAHETLGGATAAAAHLPAQTADALLGTAHVAFVHGMHAAALAGAAVLAAAAVLSAVLLRDAGAVPERRSPATAPGF